MDEKQGFVKMCMLLCRFANVQQVLKNYAEIFMF